MKKCLLIVFIFLAGFIFAGAEASRCDAFYAQSTNIIQNTGLSKSNAFINYENDIIHENLKSIKNNTEIDKSTDIQPVKILSFSNNTNRLSIEKQYAGIRSENYEQKFKEIKYNLHPRAP